MLLNAWQKSLLNLKHKIVKLNFCDPSGKSVEYNRCRVVSVNLDGPGVSIVTEEGRNIIIDGSGASLHYEIIEVVPRSRDEVWEEMIIRG